MSGAFEIRSAESGDLPRLANALADDYRDTLVLAGTPAELAVRLADAMLREPMQKLADSPYLVMLAAYDSSSGEIAGACALSTVTVMKVTYVLHAWVVPEHRENVLLVETMMRHIARVARKRGTARVEWPVFVSNPRLLEQVARAGWMTTGYVMSKRL